MSQHDLGFRLGHPMQRLQDSARSVDLAAPRARLRVARERPSVEGEQLIVTEFASGQPVDDENGR